MTGFKATDLQDFPVVQVQAGGVFHGGNIGGVRVQEAIRGPLVCHFKENKCDFSSSQEVFFFMWYLST